MTISDLEDTKNKYYELEDIINRLDSIIDDITDEKYKDSLNDIKYEMQDEMQELEKPIQEAEELEARAEEQEYENSVL